MKWVAAILAIILIPGIMLMIFTSGETDSCVSDSVIVNPGDMPAPTNDFDSEQIANAAEIISAAPLSAPMQAQRLAVAVGIAENDLRAPLEDAATFYSELQASDGWQAKEPTLAINAVRGNPDPYFYEAAAVAAAKLLAAFGATNHGCEAGPPGDVNRYGWASPAAGDITSTFGPRPVICSAGGCSRGFHYGLDLANAAGTPIYAAAAGRVVAAGPNGTYGHWILLDHGDGIATVYAHMWPDGVHVRVGQNVSAGQHIADIGCAGACTGAHLHFEVRQSGATIDPIPFMAERGITFG